MIAENGMYFDSLTYSALQPKGRAPDKLHKPDEQQIKITE